MRRQSGKRQALVPIRPLGQGPHHKVANWEWDFQIEGYVSTAARDFECDCGAPIPTPSHTKCACGKIWNSYVIGSAPNDKEASIEKYVCREIMVRPGVMVASKGSPVRKIVNASAIPVRDSILAARKLVHLGTLERLYDESQDNIRRHSSNNYNQPMVQRRKAVELSDSLNLPPGATGPYATPDEMSRRQDKKGPYATPDEMRERGDIRFQSSVDKLYRESLQNIEAEGRHRRDYEWQGSPNDSKVDLYPHGGSGFLNFTGPDGWKAQDGMGENKEYFDSRDDAVDHLERMNVPTGGGRHSV